MFTRNLDHTILKNIPSTATAVAASLMITQNPIIAAGALIATPILSTITNKALVDVYGSSYNAYYKYHESLRHLVIAHSLN